MPASGRVERIDKIQEQLVDQTAQSPTATQKPPMVPSQPTKLVTWQTDGSAVITTP